MQVNPEQLYLRMLHIVRRKAQSGSVVKVAVVDDGFRLTHQAIRDYIYTNPGEVPGNYQDDDHNGFKDDLHGWDISDNDNDVSVPKGREEMFYHGTYIAGIITEVFTEYFGKDAKKFLKIIPVKVLPDKARNTYMADAYRGIEYAAGLDADIICCAWAGGVLNAAEKSILDKALAKGIMIIGSAGNFNIEVVNHPADYPGIFCAASVDTSRHKCKFSNYGMRTDIVAPGDSVYGPHPLADNAFFRESGTSSSAAIIAGCAAILKSVSPRSAAADVFDALQNTARPVDSLNVKYCGKLGSGLPDVDKAIQYVAEPDVKYTTFSPSRAKGKIVFGRKRSPVEWMIHPHGAYKGIHIASSLPESNKRVKLYKGDSLFYSGPAGGISNSIYIPGDRFRIALDPEGGLPKELSFSYCMETIDSTSLYCHDEVEISDAKGVITDGSGPEDYANNCACKWLINAPEGKHIKIEFLSLDTQPNVDFVWLFDGEYTLPENLLAKFSGTNIPPVIVSFTNKMLIWFLTDGAITRKGWEISYEIVD